MKIPPPTPQSKGDMDLPVTGRQFEAITSAKHLPDVLKRVLDTARPGDGGEGGRLLHLTYEEAVALNELCSWNVHLDADGNVTPETRIFDDLVKAILTHPDY